MKCECKCGIRLAREGANQIIISLLLLVAAVLGVWFHRSRCTRWLFFGATVWAVAVLQFFRDPKRLPPRGEGLILSPADGRIIAVDPPLGTPLSKSRRRVSIFMSPLNAHVNRSPVEGKVVEVNRYPGKFLSAFKPEAERENERVEIKMSTSYGEVTFCQVAGYLARRIVFHPRPGDTLTAGERVGMIRYGSRVDVYLPANVHLFVSLGQKVWAGETILGEFADAV
ncbi:MAG: phosphatidylserine decarboxylase family protein [Calditrichota bacterium]